MMDSRNPALSFFPADLRSVADSKAFLFMLVAVICAVEIQMRGLSYLQRGGKENS